MFFVNIETLLNTNCFALLPEAYAAFDPLVDGVNNLFYELKYLAD